MSAENEKLKECIACLTNQNTNLKKDFANIEGVNTYLVKALVSKKKLVISMEDENRRDTLKYEMQEKELKEKRDEVINLKDQLYPLFNRDESLSEVVKERVIR